MVNNLSLKVLFLLHKSTLLFFSAVLIALGLTFLYVNEYDAYQVSGQEWLTNSDFSQGLDEWKASRHAHVNQDESGVITLSSPVSAKYVALYQPVTVPSRSDSNQSPLLVRLSGFAQTQDIKKGKKAWHQGRFALVLYNENGKSRVTHALPLPWGDSKWAYYKDVFEIPPEVHKIRVNINILQVTGTVQVKQVSLVPVTLKAEAIYVKSLGFVLWLLMILWLMWGYIVCLWKHSKMGLLFISALMVGAMVSGGIKAQLTSQLPILSYPITSFIVLDWDMLGHFTLFLVAAFWFVCFFDRKRWWQVVIDLMLLGLFIECLQLFVVGRTADLMDLWVDFSGVLMGIVLAMLWLKIRPKQPLLAT